MADPITILLTAPIQAHGHTHTELVIRQPTVKELRQAGQPYRVGNGVASADYEACHRLISMICAIPPSSVDQLDGADFDEIAMILVGFMNSDTRRARAVGSESRT